MAVTRASKVEDLKSLEDAFKGTQSAVLVDYRGLKVPEVTELRRQVRGARGEGPGDQGWRSFRARHAAGQAGALREAPVPVAVTDGPAGERAERRTARPDECVGRGREEEVGSGRVVALR